PRDHLTRREPTFSGRWARRGTPSRAGRPAARSPGQYRAFSPAARSRPDRRPRAAPRPSTTQPTQPTTAGEPSPGNTQPPSRRPGASPRHRSTQPSRPATANKPSAPQNTAAHSAQQHVAHPVDDGGQRRQRFDGLGQVQALPPRATGEQAAPRTPPRDPSKDR